MSNIIFITGPTATGKTEVSYKIAKQIGAHIISCDSMLVYREPWVITSKPSADILQEVAHHCIDIVSVAQTYNVFTYYKQAITVISSLLEQSNPVIVCGGTGLYMSALLDGIFEGASQDLNMRKELTERAKREGKEALYKELMTVDRATADKISCNDLRRIVRALEVYYATGIPLSEKKKERKGLWGQLPVKIIGLTMERKMLYERINKRSIKMFDDGAIEEVKNLLQLPLSITAQKIIGIEEIKGFLEGRYSRDEAQGLMAKNTRNFAKRQITWFRRDSRVQWVDTGRLTSEEVKDKIIEAICTKQ